MAADPSNVLSSSGDYHLNLTSDTAARFRELMQEFLDETDCSLAAVIERSGAVIASVEGTPARGVRVPRPDSLGVLTAGLFASTQMMATQMGEDSAPEVLCHGEDLHVFVAPISEEFALLTVFPDRVAVGLVRLHARKVGKSMMEDLSQIVRSQTTLAPSTGAVTESDESDGPFMRFN